MSVVVYGPEKGRPQRKTLWAHYAEGETEAYGQRSLASTWRRLLSNSQLRGRWSGYRPSRSLSLLRGVFFSVSLGLRGVGGHLSPTRAIGAREMEEGSSMASDLESTQTWNQQRSKYEEQNHALPSRDSGFGPRAYSLGDAGPGVGEAGSQNHPLWPRDSAAPSPHSLVLAPSGRSFSWGLRSQGARRPQLMGPSQKPPGSNKQSSPGRGSQCHSTEVVSCRHATPLPLPFGTPRRLDFLGAVMLCNVLFLEQRMWVMYPNGYCWAENEIAAH